MTRGQEITEWDSIARQYADWLTDPSDRIGKAFTDVVTTAMLEIIGDSAGARVLDLGCGEGYLARCLADRGAVVDGVDGAKEMLAIAWEKADGRRITFEQADICLMLPYPDDVFDLAICNMVLMDVDDLDTTIKHAARVLTPGGRFIFSIVHPCFFDATGDWRIGASGSPEFIPRRRYILPVSYQKTLVGFDPPAKLTHHHRPIQTYVRTVLSAGLTITDFVETSMRRYPEHPELMRYHLTANNLIMAARK